jgi:NADH-quinone oxidoreductase subunit A
VNGPAVSSGPLWPLAVYFVAVIVLVAGMLGLSYVLGQRHQDKATGEVYESGILSTGTARLRISAKFYLVAVFFVVFDLEAVFIFAWAVALREVGWSGYIEALIFIAVLVATLVYLWREGALDWGPARVRRLARPSVTPSAEPEVRVSSVSELRPVPGKARSVS